MVPGSTADNDIGMQLRAVAILLLNDVAPKVFQLQHSGNFDTHSDQVGHDSQAPPDPKRDPAHERHNAE